MTPILCAIIGSSELRLNRMKWGDREMFHTILVLFTMMIMPLICFLWEGHKKCYSIEILCKWFLFWIVGVRGLTAGAMQFMNPSYTMSLLQLGEESRIAIMELGAAQFGIGILGVLSLFKEKYRSSVAISYGCFMVGAIYIHISRFTIASADEIMSLIGDLLFLVIALLYLVHTKRSTRGVDR